MFSPVRTSVELVMAERHGIEIDDCPVCRGVWLDRGELDKLIERSIRLVRSGPAHAASAQDRSRSHASHQGFKDSDVGQKDHGRAQQGQHGPHGRRRPFRHELFD